MSVKKAQAKSKPRRGVRCPYCGEQHDLARKGRTINCLTCGNDSQI